jgi:hypothetical protein
VPWLGATVATGIAKWDGSAWTALDGGMTPYTNVYALCLDDEDNLYAAAGFLVAGGGVFGGIARWDGTAWSPISEICGSIFALCFDDAGNLYE